MTRTSARPGCKPLFSRGFTLIEILVVLAIIGVVSSLVVVKLEASDASKVRRAVEDLAAVLEAARDEAVFSGRQVAISSDGLGYQLWNDSGSYGEWVSLPADGILHSGKLADGVRWQSQRVNDRPQALGERIVLPPDGVVDPFDVELVAGQTRLWLAADVMGRIEMRDAAAP